MHNNMKDDEIVCRCEEVTYGEIKKAINEGAEDLDAIKRMTRAGMGLCQCKTCVTIIADILSKEKGIEKKFLPPFTTRPPVRPIAASCWSAENNVYYKEFKIIKESFDN